MLIGLVYLLLLEGVTGGVCEDRIDTLGGKTKLPQPPSFEGVGHTMKRTFSLKKKCLTLHGVGVVKGNSLHTRLIEDRTFFVLQRDTKRLRIG